LLWFVEVQVDWGCLVEDYVVLTVRLINEGEVDVVHIGRIIYLHEVVYDV